MLLVMYSVPREISWMSDGTVPSRLLNDKSLLSVSNRPWTRTTHMYVKLDGKLSKSVPFNPCPLTTLEISSSPSSF